MKNIFIGLIVILGASHAVAGDAENISACVKKTKEFSGLNLDAFDVYYEGNLLSMSVAKWKNALCEVKVGEVYTLNVNGSNFIYRGYAGKESYDLNEELDRRTEEAINQMNGRIALLKQRRNQVSVSLQRPKPDPAWLTRYVNDGIDKSLGKQH